MTYLGNSPGSSPSIVVSEYIATAGQTTFSASYYEYVQVYLNGMLLSASDYVANDGSTVVLAVGANAGDVVLINGYEVGLQGIKGDTGAQGLKGDKGDTGDVGPQGVKGDTGEVSLAELNAAIAGIDALPTQAGNGGKYLTTDGTAASWGTIDTSKLTTTQTAKTFLAAPNATSGVPTYRAIVASDVPILNQSTTGNAATATTLQTARTINGVSFNGSANINIESRLGTAVPSDTTTTIGTVGSGDTLHITGTTTITNLGVSTTGVMRTVVFDGELVLRHNVDYLILPTRANITTAAGDTAEFICENGASGYWRCVRYDRADGKALVNLVSPTYNGIGAVAICWYSGTPTIGAYIAPLVGFAFTNNTLNSGGWKLAGTWQVTSYFSATNGAITLCVRVA